MIGAILGDIIGSLYEFDNGDRTKNFPLFSKNSTFTDDTVMSVSVADAFMKTNKNASDEEIKHNLIASMQYYGRLYPDAGYGDSFIKWLYQDKPKAYNSFGNGSAMRVSSIGWIFDSLEDVRRMAKLSAEVSHNHPEGIKGAESVASAIFLARTGHTKNQIKNYIESEFEYNLNRTCDEIRSSYKWDVSCMKSVPEAITAFLEGENFEDVIRTAISLGGDADTIGAIAGSIAEAYYEIPDFLKNECFKRLPKNLLTVVLKFENLYNHKF